MKTFDMNKIYDKKPPVKVGLGYDVHRLQKDTPLTIGGCKIDFYMGLEGHSDADVLVHAIMDALIGALGQGDIGKWFPDTDPAYKDINSLKLLEKVREAIDKSDYYIGNIDAAVIAQRPKLSGYREEMSKNLAEVLEMPSELINIKFTTEEKLGFTGRLEGISAQAVCSLILRP